MRILLDHCVDRRLAPRLEGHEVLTAKQMEWQDLKNGQLLAAAAKSFHAVITTDKNLRYQHDLSTLPIAVVEINTFRNRLKDFVHLIPKLNDALAATRTHLFIVLHDDGSIEKLAPRGGEPTTVND